MIIQAKEIDRIQRWGAPRQFGRVAHVSRTAARIVGLSGAARLGDFVEVVAGNADRRLAQIVSANDEHVEAAAFVNFDGVATGDRAFLDGAAHFVSPGIQWLGRVIDPFGASLDGAPLRDGHELRPLEASPPPSVRRKKDSVRLKTSLAVFDTLLPIVRGQRIGIFAGPGVGKTSLLGQLASGIAADVVIIALIGERSREVNHFAHDLLGDELKAKSIVFASTADQAPIAKKRGAKLAIAAAEHFREGGQQVLLIFDSLTRYAEAHREIALAAGEPPTLHGYPPSTFRELAGLVERTGPGCEGEGDITAVFSVLVEGGELETAPAADTIRGLLDGHIVLDRRLAEEGRFPAVDVLRSVSRALPAAASKSENQLIADARHVVSLREESDMIVRAGLYTQGADPKLDRVLTIWPEMETYLTSESESISESFVRLEALMGMNSLESLAAVRTSHQQTEAEVLEFGRRKSG